MLRSAAALSLVVESLSALSRRQGAPERQATGADAAAPFNPCFHVAMENVELKAGTKTDIEMYKRSWWLAYGRSKRRHQCGPAAFVHNSTAQRKSEPNNLALAIGASRATAGGMCPVQYRAVMQQVLASRPAGLLVFSVGNDAPLWRCANVNSPTLFVENNIAWMKKISSQFPGTEIEQVNYTSKVPECRRQAKAIAEGNKQEALYVLKQLDLPSVWSRAMGKARRPHQKQRSSDSGAADAAPTVWRTIVIDGPGEIPNGRLQPSVYAMLSACSTVADHGGDVQVFIHDAQRSCEEAATQYLFGGDSGYMQRCQLCTFDEWVTPYVYHRPGVAMDSNGPVALYQFKVDVSHPFCKRLVALRG